MSHAITVIMLISLKKLQIDVLYSSVNHPQDSSTEYFQIEMIDSVRYILNFPVGLIYVIASPIVYVLETVII